MLHSHSSLIAISGADVDIAINSKPSKYLNYIQIQLSSLEEPAAGLCRVEAMPAFGLPRRRAQLGSRKIPLSSYIWHCCLCGSAPQSINAAGCSTCFHERCTECLIDKVKPGDAHRSTVLESNKETNVPTTAAARKGEQQIYVETPGRADPTAGQISKTAVAQQRQSPQTQDPSRDLLDVNDSLNHHVQPAGSFDTDPTDTETIFSAISSATTLGDLGTVEEFARNIMTFQGLGCLWPQLLGCCDRKERCIHVMERLLKRYAQDLKLLSLEMQGFKLADSQLCHAAARFVRKSRLQVAHKIWKAQALDLENFAVKDAMESLSGIDGPNLEIEEEGDEPTDDDLLFETVEEILFNKGPILSLRANIKLLINLSNSTDQGIFYRISTSLSTSIKNAISPLYEPYLPRGHTRLRYTCVSFNDFRCICILNYSWIPRTHCY